MSDLSQEILAYKPALLAKFLWYDTNMHTLEWFWPQLLQNTLVEWILVSSTYIIYDEDCFLAIFTGFLQVC